MYLNLREGVGWLIVGGPALRGMKQIGVWTKGAVWVLVIRRFAAYRVAAGRRGFGKQGAFAVGTDADSCRVPASFGNGRPSLHGQT